MTARTTDGRAEAARLFANEADPAFRRRALWIGAALSRAFPRGGARLLDLGCGRGFYLPLYAALGLAATGVEPDPLPRREAEARAREAGARVLDAPAEALPFPAAAFDAAVLSEVLEHLADPGAALREVHRVLAPGGLLLATVPKSDYPLAWDPLNFLLEGAGLGPIRRGPLAGIWANHRRLYDEAALSREAEAAGFEVRDVFGHTSRCLPFVHNLVYGLGKPLLERDLLPRAWARGAERGRGRAPGRPSRVDPVAWGIALIHRIDRANPDREPPGRRAQNICLEARRRA